MRYCKYEIVQSVSLFTLLGVLFIVNCINIQDVEEGPCFVAPVDPNFDLLWITNYPEWYSPILSRYTIYNWIVSLTGLEEKYVTEDMVRRSCMILYSGGVFGSLYTAFRGTRKAAVEPVLADQGIFDWAEKKSDGTIGFRGRSYMSLTDNDKYFVTTTCWENQNKSGYAVYSNVRTLDEESKSAIRSHLKSLGFEGEKNWFDMQYDDCIDFNPREYQTTTNVPPSQNNGNNTFPEMTFNSSNSAKDEQFNIRNKNSTSTQISNSRNKTTIKQNPVNRVPSISIQSRPRPDNPFSPINNIGVSNVGISESVNYPTTISSRATPASEYFFDIFRTIINYFQKLYGDVMKNVLRITVRVISRMGLGSILL